MSRLTEALLSVLDGSSSEKDVNDILVEIHGNAAENANYKKNRDINNSEGVSPDELSIELFKLMEEDKDLMTLNLDQLTQCLVLLGKWELPKIDDWDIYSAEEDDLEEIRYKTAVAIVEKSFLKGSELSTEEIAEIERDKTNLEGQINQARELRNKEIKKAISITQSLDALNRILDINTAAKKLETISNACLSYKKYLVNTSIHHAYKNFRLNEMEKVTLKKNGVDTPLVVSKYSLVSTVMSRLIKAYLDEVANCLNFSNFEGYESNKGKKPFSIEDFFNFAKTNTQTDSVYINKYIDYSSDIEKVQLKKYLAVTGLQQILAKSDKESSDQLKEFETTFKKIGSPLLLNRDSASTKFLKVITSIIVLPVSLLTSRGFDKFNIWKSNGKLFAEDVNNTLGQKAGSGK